MRPVERCAQRPEAEHLRGERPPQIRALHRLGDRRIGAAPDPRSALQRIAHPRREQPPHGVRAEPIEETPEVGGVETRPGGVVHEDPVARARAGSERLERPTHRVAAPLAALDGRHRARAGGGKTRRHFLPIRIIPRECHHELRAAPIAEKRRERPLDHGPAFEGRVLLAHTGAEAAA